MSCDLSIPHTPTPTPILTTRTTVEERMIWKALLLVLSSGLSCYCYPSGAPAAACGTLSPDPVAHQAAPQSSPPPYWLNLTSLDHNGVASYVPGETYLSKFFVKLVTGLRSRDVTSLASQTPQSVLGGVQSSPFT